MQVKAFLSVESNDYGQMIQDVALAAKKAFPTRNVPAYCYTAGAGVPRVRQVLEFWQRVADGQEEGY